MMRCVLIQIQLPDVVYMMTSSGATYDFSLCTNTAYDSKYILDATGNVVITDATTYGIACNDDACSTPHSQAHMYQNCQVSI